MSGDYEFPPLRPSSAQARPIVCFQSSLTPLALITVVLCTQPFMHWIFSILMVGSAFLRLSVCTGGRPGWRRRRMHALVRKEAVLLAATASCLAPGGAESWFCLLVLAVVNANLGALLLSAGRLDEALEVRRPRISGAWLQHSLHKAGDAVCAAH